MVVTKRENIEDFDLEYNTIEVKYNKIRVYFGEGTLLRSLIVILESVLLLYFISNRIIDSILFIKSYRAYTKCWSKSHLKETRIKEVRV